MYRSTGCRWAHGWIFLASPSSSICYRCTVSLTLGFVLVVYSTLSYYIIRVSDDYHTEAVNSAVRNNVSTIYNSPFVETLPSIKPSTPTYTASLTRSTPRLGESFDTSGVSFNALSIHRRIVIFNAVINTRQIYRANALLFFPRLFFTPLHQPERKLSNTFTLFHPSIYSLGARTRYSTASDTLFERRIRR
jgi:hypothetical protein